MSKAVTNRGKRAWCVRTALSSDGEVHLTADVARLTDNGDLMFLIRATETVGFAEDEAMVSFASGFWTAFYLTDEAGAARGVAHWPETAPQGEVA